ncbi:MAG TPA: HAD family hydrolase [Oribacterium sp.]|nr:HAD family hydrolase [Oribacterium sp.]
MIRNVIFDVDGTLWDSAQQVTEAWREVLLRHPETAAVTITLEDMYRYMGHTMYEISCMMLPAISEGLRALIMQECMEHEDEYLRVHSGIFYSGCMETIEQLHEEGYSVYIVSNCQDGYIETLLEDAGWILGPMEIEGDVQDFECYGRTGKKKGSNIRLLMERNALSKESCVYVGDTAMDEAGAREAGISFIHAAYGFGTAEHPQAVIHALSELPELLRQNGGL